MKKRTTYITGIILFVAILIAVFVFVKVYNKPHTDVNASDPDYITNVENLVQEFTEDETKANTKYLDEIIQVEGTLVGIQDNNNTLTLNSGNASGQVIVTMKTTEKQNITALKKGHKITVKGICTGFLLDVMMVQGVIVD